MYIVCVVRPTFVVVGGDDLCQSIRTNSCDRGGVRFIISVRFPSDSVVVVSNVNAFAKP